MQWNHTDWTKTSALMEPSCILWNRCPPLNGVNSVRVFQWGRFWNPWKCCEKVIRQDYGLYNRMSFEIFRLIHECSTEQSVSDALQHERTLLLHVNPVEWVEMETLFISWLYCFWSAVAAYHITDSFIFFIHHHSSTRHMVQTLSSIHGASKYGTKIDPFTLRLLTLS